MKQSVAWASLSSLAILPKSSMDKVGVALESSCSIVNTSLIVSEVSDVAEVKGARSESEASELRREGKYYRSSKVDTKGREQLE